MVDIHSHLLPGIDDGARTMNEALALAQACVDDGIRHVVVTPHIYPGLYDNEQVNIAAAYDEFARAVEEAAIGLGVSFAGEVRLSPEVMPMIEEGRVPFLGEVDGYRNMLLELPDGQIPVGAPAFIAWLQARRIRAIVVHPERNKAVMEHPEKMRSFVEAGCELQVTAGSIVGHFGSRAQAAAEALLDKGWVHAVASDSHNLRSRPPMMRAARNALLRRYGRETALRLTQWGPARLCQVEPGRDSGWQAA